MRLWRARQARLRWFTLAVGLTASVAWGFSGSGCILGDHCIVLVTKGNDWCAELVNAQKWPAGHPELAEIVKDDDDAWPRGCACFNVAEEEILLAGVPEVKYEEFLGQISKDARNNCDLIVPFGWDHNCYDESLDGPVLLMPAYWAQGECVGDCSYINEPKNGGCGDDPSPYACEELYGNGDETGAGSSTADGETTNGETTTPDVPQEVQWPR